METRQVLFADLLHTVVKFMLELLVDELAEMVTPLAHGGRRRWWLRLTSWVGLVCLALALGSCVAACDSPRGPGGELAIFGVISLGAAACCWVICAIFDRRA